MVRKVTPNTHWANNGDRVWYAWTRGMGLGKPTRFYLHTFSQAIYYAQARSRGVEHEHALIDAYSRS